jgi:lactoylglutathione lyase
MFTTLFPILTTSDLGPVLRFYRDLLGATVSYEFAGPDGEPGYVGLELGTAHLGIGRDPAATAGPSPRFSLWVYAEDCDAAWSASVPPSCRSSKSPPTSRGGSGSRRSSTPTATPC